MFKTCLASKSRDKEAKPRIKPGATGVWGGVALRWRTPAEAGVQARRVAAMAGPVVTVASPH